MSKGFVYILTNEAMPGLVKIGMTTGDPESRASQLQTTGVPLPFHVAHSVLSPNCADLEARIHGVFPDLRVSGSREFFRCEVKQAIDMLDHLHLEQLHDVTGEYTETHVLVEELYFVDPSCLAIIADIIGREAYEIPQLLGEARSDDEGVDFQELAKRYDARLARRASKHNKGAPVLVCGDFKPEVLQ